MKRAVVPIRLCGFGPFRGWPGRGERFSVLRNRRLLTIIALMMANFLSAVDITIVETAMPRIVGALGGFSLFTWVVTGYMLTATATVPIYGKLCDLIGRKRTFTIGALIFIVGSVLCGIAQTMEQLIFFRCVQGLGAGALIPTVQTIAGDLFSPTERAKVQVADWDLCARDGPALL